MKNLDEQPRLTADLFGLDGCRMPR